MNAGNFLNELSQLKWTIATLSDDFEKNYNYTSIANGRIKGAPDELKKFITSFATCANKEDNIWFLSILDYLNETDAAFAWNEFELQSIEYADQNEIEKINKFWSTHLPFLLSVKGEYSFVAIVIDGENIGDIVVGNEPEYENVSKIASNINDFFDIYIAFLKDETDILSLKMLK